MSQTQTTESQRRKRRTKVRRPRSTASRGRVWGLLLAAFSLVLTGIIGWLWTAPDDSTLLLLGTDSAGEPGRRGRSDVLVLLRVDHRNDGVTALQLPRDLWVKLPDSSDNRLNAAYAQGGPDWTLQTIRENLGVRVDGYVRFDFADLESLVEAVGGVRVQLDRSMAGYEAGKHLMTGKRMLAFIRHRRTSGDFGRMRRLQSIVLPAMMAEARSNLRGTISFAVEYLISGDYEGVHPATVLTLARVKEIRGETLSSTMVREIKTSAGALVLCGDMAAIVPLLKRGFWSHFVGLQVLPSGTCLQP